MVVWLFFSVRLLSILVESAHRVDYKFKTSILRCLVELAIRHLIYQ